MREYNAKLRKHAYKKLSEFCWACNSKKHLCLHHDYYASNSVKSDANTGGSKRYLEAITHPERFIVLCSSCHTKHHMQEKRDKLIELLPTAFKTNIS